jgi:hypothetical protein
MVADVTAWLSFLAALLACHNELHSTAHPQHLEPPTTTSNINTNWIAVADLFCFH